MEGNFYIAERLVRRKNKSRLDEVIRSCNAESLAYGRCIEVHQVNKTVKIAACLAERDVLDQCLDKELSSVKHTRSKVPLV